MNKKAQVGNWEEIIKFILIAPVLLAFIGAIIAMTGSFNKECPTCPTCDCSNFQNNLSICIDNINNLTKYINETPVRYIQNISNIITEVPVEKIVYRDTVTSVTIISISLILSIILTISLFKIEIKLPEYLEKKLEEKFKNIEWLLDGIALVIFNIKWISLIISILILFKLIMILISF